MHCLKLNYLYVYTILFVYYKPNISLIGGLPLATAVRLDDASVAFNNLWLTLYQALVPLLTPLRLSSARVANGLHEP